MKQILILSILSLFIMSCKSDKNNDKEISNFQFDIPDSETETPKSTLYYFVRHAEKDTSDPKNDDPELTDKGLERAAFISEFFKKKNLDALYATSYKRNLQTIIPTAHYYRSRIEDFDPNADTLFTKEFWKNTYGKNVLIVGHSNTNPRFVNEILQSKKYENLDEDNYNTIFQVEITKDLKVKDSVFQLKMNGETME
ncbi:histidine phosphatase family protein [Psychroflexus aestuariivivens]|uniref:histidine phosphatase family protein n=1 Tax=Psychroflexus aestuariivivens TaxID=1795040 RepID=UPI000FD95CDC|nr:phosphoglycerate mutase family protein [Psychroflexus aestuariivivens]